MSDEEIGYGPYNILPSHLRIHHPSTGYCSFATPKIHIFDYLARCMTPDGPATGVVTFFECFVCK